MSEQSIIKELDTHRALLEAERSRYEPLFRDIRDYIAPRTARFSGEMVAKGTREDANILNSSVRFASRTLPSGLQSGITSPLRPWFTLGTPDPELQEFSPVKVWLHDTVRRMLEVLSRSNVYDRLKSTYGTMGDYGTACLWVEDDDDEVIRAHHMLMGTFLLYTDERGRVEGCFREISMTVLQMVGKFGEKVNSTIRNQFDRGEKNERYTVIHSVKPNPNFKQGSALPQHKKYTSVWYMKGDADRILRFSGYNTIPFFGPRWDVIGEEVWGIGCGEIAIGDSRQTTLMEKRKLQGIDKNANPPMIADASLKNTRKSNVPGGTTYVNGLINANPGYRPAYQVNPYTNELRAEIEAVTQRIDEAYFKNLFLLIAEIGAQPNITATQINTMKEEKLLMLGPVLERVNDELLDGLIDRLFNSMLERGLLAPPPPDLDGVQLKVEYISIMAQAQKAIGVANIERYIGFVGQVAQYDPTALDKLNVDEAIEEYANSIAVDPSLVRGNDEASEIRGQRQQQQAQQQLIDQAGNAGKVAKDLADVDITGDNIVTRSMEAAGVGF